MKKAIQSYVTRCKRYVAVDKETIFLFKFYGMLIICFLVLPIQAKYTIPILHANVDNEVMAKLFSGGMQGQTELIVVLVIEQLIITMTMVPIIVISILAFIKDVIKALKKIWKWLNAKERFIEREDSKDVRINDDYFR